MWIVETIFLALFDLSTRKLTWIRFGFKMLSVKWQWQLGVWCWSVKRGVGGRQEGSRTWAGSSNNLQADNIDKHTLGQAGVRGMSSSLSPLSLSFSESTTGQFRGMSSSVTHHSSPSLSLNQKHHPNLYPDPIFVDRLSWWSLPWCRALAEMENRFASLVTGQNQSWVLFLLHSVNHERNLIFGGREGHINKVLPAIDFVGHWGKGYNHSLIITREGLILTLSIVPFYRDAFSVHPCTQGRIDQSSP